MSKKKRSRRPSGPSTVATAPVTPAIAAAPAIEGHTSLVDESSEVAEVDVGPMLEQAAQTVDEAPAAPAKRKSGAKGTPVETTAAKPSPAAAPSTSSTLRSFTGDEAGDIRGVLIQVAGGKLLLPNATIAEVLSYAEPESEGSGADWLLGRMRWRGWQLPLVAFSQLAGIGEEKPGLGSKVIVLKALGGDRRIPFFALVTQGFPRLVTVSRSALSVEDSDGQLPMGVQALLRLNDEPALLPDLMQIEQCLRDEREQREAA